MKTGFALLESLIRDERGSTAMEYVVIAAVIAMAIFGAVGFAGDGMTGIFNSASDSANESLINSSNVLN